MPWDCVHLVKRSEPTANLHQLCSFTTHHPIHSSLMEVTPNATVPIKVALPLEHGQFKLILLPSLDLSLMRWQRTATIIGKKKDLSYVFNDFLLKVHNPSTQKKNIYLFIQYVIGSDIAF